MQKRKILLVLEPAVRGEDYESKYVPLLLKYLNPEEINLSIVCSSVGTKIFESYSKNIEEVRWGPTKARGLSLIVGYLLYMVFAFLKTLALAKREHPHLILSLGGHTFSGVIVTAVSKVISSKSIIRIAGPTRQTMKSRYALGVIFSAAAGIIEFFVFRLCDGLLSNSDLSGYLSQKNLNKMKIVRQGVDTEIFTPALSRESKIRPTIITVSRLSPEKRIENLIESVIHLRETYPEVKLKIVGDGPEKDKLMRKVRELVIDSSVEFLGYLKQQDVRNEIVHSDVFALPSLRESLPSALLEAMACKVPTIVAREWISRLEFKDREHTLVCDASPKGLAKAVSQIIENEEMRGTITGGAYRIIQEEYSIGNSRNNFLRVMNEILEN
ncbi:MAG: glycosyltransferase family 4 protein [Candidatus Thorarchaeota archaeon]